MANQGSVADAASSAPQQADYKSALFGQFSRKLAKLPADSPILDLGPSTPRNVMYWIRRGHPVSALDLVTRDDGETTTLDYDDATFGGVLCWTALSHQSPESARELVQEIGRVLRPDGWLFAVFDGDGRHEPKSHRYRILDDDHLAFERMNTPSAPRAVLTREIEMLLQPFREVRVMVMRHGSREALGRRP